MSQTMLLLMLLLTSTLSISYYTRITESNPITSVDFSADSSLIAVGTTGTTHKIYSFSTLKVAHTHTSTTAVTSVKFSPDQKLIAFGQTVSTVVILNSDYTLNTTIPSQFGTIIRQVDFNANSNRIIVCGRHAAARRGYEIWTIPPGATPINHNYNYGAEPLACRFSSTNTFAVSDLNGNIFYYLANYALSWTYTNNNNPNINALAFSPNASLLAAGLGHNRLRIVTFNTASNTGTNHQNTGDIYYCVDYSPDGMLLASGDDGGNLRVYDVMNSYRNFQNITSLSNVTTVDFSGDSCWLAAGSNDRNVYLYTANCMKKQSARNPPLRCPIHHFKLSATQCQSCISTLIGCRRCSNALVCLACTDQYYLNTSSKCSLCSQINLACVQCSNSTTCTSCISTYYVNGTSCSLCFQAIPGCVTCTNETYCLTCGNNSYYFDSVNNNCSVCSVALPNCVDCLSEDTCVACQHSYFANTTGSCQKCSMNCSTCVTNSTNCLSCDNGYYLAVATCSPCPWNCKRCTGATTCSMCVNGFFLSSSTCTPCNSKCQSCTTSATNCLSCNVGFYLNGNTCSLCNTNCATCNTTASSCRSCNIGYYLNAAASTCLSCTGISAKCLLCNSTVCYQCASGSFLNGTVCSSCFTAIPGCQLCSNNTVCLICIQRYYLSSGNCTACAWPCLSCANSTGCRSCALGYYLNTTNSSCLKCNCPTCNSSTNCLSCASDQYLSSGSCLFCNNIHAMCRSCNSSTHCLDCTPPYYRNGSNCSICSIGCSSCLNSTSCKTCNLGYYLATTTCTLCPLICSTCISSSNCTECIDGYYLSSGSCLACSGISTGCDFCNSTVCLSCSYIGGYYLNSTTCATCRSAMPGCEVCTADNVCVECDLSYALNDSNSECIPCSDLMPFCQSCSSNTSCTKCLAGYYANAAICSPCSNGCFQCTTASVCKKCLPQFWLTATSTCTECASSLLGCDRCSSATVCLQCGFGFYLSGNNCIPCLSSLAGCQACNTSSDCLSCQNGYYLNSSSNTCDLCGQNMTGCGFCRNSGTCDICLSGYFLTLGQCQLCSTPNCLACNTTQCIQCMSGFYLNSTSCDSCSSLFLGCIMCNSTSCQSCQSGYFINGTGCSRCSKVGCSVCNNTNPSLCISCSPTYFLNAGSCNFCSSALSNCIICTSNGLSCNMCNKGYFINGSDCGLCSAAIPNCRSCSTNAICTSCDSGSLLISASCTQCRTLMEGCMFCSSSTACSNCQQGYYLNTSNLCQRCTLMTACLICRNINECNLCNTGYFLQSGVCKDCNSTMEGCIACSSNLTCIACSSKYNLDVFVCTIITNPVSYYPYEELKLKSVYVNATTLKHTLWVYGTTFAYTDLDLMELSNLTYVTTGGQIVTLTITAFEWGKQKKSIIFYTNNPFNLKQYSSDMKTFSKRLLQVSHFGPKQKIHDRLKEVQFERILQSLTNIQINANFQLTMDQSTVLTLIPASLHGGDLYLSYSANQPQFIASAMVIFDYNYHYFGICIAIYLFVFYFVKGVVIDTKGKDKGQLIAHILLLKTPVLMLYPTYAELINYCQGFMIADMPWINNFFAGLFSDPRDSTPAPYLLFYSSLSIASTFLLPIIFMVLSYIILTVISYFKKEENETIANIGLIIYNYFLGGLSFAAVACVQGAFLNPIENDLTVVSGFYLFGILFFLMIFGEAIWSTARDFQNIYKIRIILKSFLLSVLHYNALYLFSLVLGVQVFFILMIMKHSKMNHPKLWLCSNILPNISFFFLVELSRSIASIYISSTLVLVSLMIEFSITVKEHKISKMITDVKLDNVVLKLPDRSYLKTMDMFMEGDQHRIVQSLDQSNHIILKKEFRSRPSSIQDAQKVIGKSSEQFFMIDQIINSE